MKNQKGFIVWALPGLVSVLAIALGVLVFWAAVEDSRQWAAFKVTHNCKKVGHKQGQVFNTVSIGANGQPSIGVATTPDQTAWQCDDGVTYWR